MDFDPKFALERFRGLTREELLEEAALRTDQYVPAALQLLRGEALARGITDAEIEARRRKDAAPQTQEAIDYPALITSAMERKEVQAIAESLRRDGIPAVVREVDTRQFHGSGCAVGRWGLFVAGAHAAEAGRRLHALFPEGEDEAPAGCGGCGGGSCASEEDAPEPGEWDEEGDWWKTGAPGEEEQ